MHPPETRAEVFRLIAAGMTDGAIGRELGLARSTVRDLRAPRRTERPLCLRCWRPTRRVEFTAGEYAELLGFYLGDGHISLVGRSQRLRISLDAAHSAVADDVARLLQRCFPANRVGLVPADHGATVIASVYSSHLACLLPQHGAGKKHERSIALEPWQRRCVEQAPWSFLRGLVHSDGCFFINRTGPYRYLSADFCNSSPEIRQLFVDACRYVGIRPRPAGTRVRIYGRQDVAEFAAFVGAKW